MGSTGRILLVAVAAGALGLIAGLMTSGPGPLLRTELGQRVLGGVLSASSPKPPAGVIVPGRGDRVAGIVLQDLSGRQVRVPETHAGRPLLVNVWATWCGPCRQEMPELQRFYAEEGANGVQVVGIALDEPAPVSAFVQQTGVRYPILLDTPGPADAGVRLGNPKGVLPYSVLLSADGRVVRQRIGPFAPGEISRWAKH